MISIVIPVYNTALFLPDCIESILQQTYSDYQIILVDDGSKDNSLEICQGYKEKSKKIIVISQNNAGQNAAVMKGLQYATGEYICFVDSDDWVEKNMLQKMIESVNRYNADCVICRTCRDDELSKPSQPPSAKEFYTREEIVKEIYPSLFCNLKGTQDTSVSNSRIGKLFKTKIIKRVIPYMNQTVRHGEDSLLSKPYILCSDSICFVNDVLYHYRRNSMSVTNFNDTFFEESLVVISVLRKASEELSDYDFAAQFQAMSLNAGLLKYYQIIQAHDSIKLTLSSFKKLCSDPGIQSGVCPQQRNSFAQTEVKALNFKNPYLLLGLSLIRRLKKSHI